MATYIVKKGDTLNKIAQQFGLPNYKGITGYASGNPDLIRVGEVLTIPEKAGPTGLAEEKPVGDISGTLPSATTAPTGGLDNLKAALRTALNEAAKNRTAERFQQVYPEISGVPGTMGSIVEMIRGSVKQSREFQETEEAFQTVLGKLREEGKAPEVIGSAESGYYQWNPTLRDWTPITSVAAGQIGTDMSDDAWVKLINAGQGDLSNIKNTQQRSRVATLLAELIPRPTDEDWVKKKYKEFKDLGYPDEYLIEQMRVSGVPQFIIDKVIPLKTVSKPAAIKGEEFGATLEYFPEALKETVTKPFKAIKEFGKGVIKGLTK